MSFKVTTETPKAEPASNKTFRLRDSMIEQLESIAGSKNISLNYLITQMLQHCLDTIEDEK